MTTIQDRFKRAYQVLRDIADDNLDYMRNLIKEDDLNLMHLRNEAKLWSDYEEDMTMIIDGVQCDPNHPDNLSHNVWETFKLLNKYM